MLKLHVNWLWQNTVLLLRLGLDTKNTWLGFANWFYHIRFGCHKYKHRSSRCLVKNIQCCCHSHGWKVSKTASTDLRTWKSWNAIFPPQPPLAPNMAISSCTGSLTVIHAVEMFIWYIRKQNSNVVILAGHFPPQGLRTWSLLLVFLTATLLAGSGTLTPATTKHTCTYSTSVHIITHMHTYNCMRTSNTDRTDRSWHSDPTPCPCQHLQPSTTLILYVLKHTCTHTQTEMSLLLSWHVT